MAESPSHRFGQIVGNLLEGIMEPVLQEFCDARGLYLDVQGERKGIRPGRKVTWTDKYGNDHDLDFVIEKGSTETTRGRPVAFIESAWRRYTKHSRNKAQEIQGAVLPIADEYHWDKPFLGAVVAGEFTKGSLDQMESVGFHVLYFPYESIVSAFASVGIDARFNETTPDRVFSDCVAGIERLSGDDYEALKSYLVREEKALFDRFLSDLSKVLDRMIERLIVIPLFGDDYHFDSIADAAVFIEGFGEGGNFRKYEVIAKYSNGDTIDASFKGKSEVLRFLRYLSN